MSNDDPPKRSARRARLYIQRSLLRRWVLEAKSGGKLMVFSPYVSPPCVTKVLLSAAGKDVELYTVFSAANFAGGASSLGVIKKLLDHQVKIYHLSGLHAKMLIVPGRVVTIGSQNMTSAGLMNLESNVVLTGADFTREVEDEVRPWLGMRRLVTYEMIEEMKEAIRKLRQEFDAAKLAPKQA